MKLRGLLTSVICALFAVVVMTAAASACCGNVSGGGGARHSAEGSGHHGDDTSRQPGKSHAKKVCATLCCAPFTESVRIGSGVTGEAQQTSALCFAGAGAGLAPSPPPPRSV